MFWCLFIGIGAFFGGFWMILDPSGVSMGMDVLLPDFQVLPLAQYLFQNFTFPGISLIIINGITNLVASFLMLKNNKLGTILGTIFGITLMLWICIQFCIFTFNFLSLSFFIFGFIQFFTGVTTLIYTKQESFNYAENGDTSVGTNSKTD